MLPNPSLVPSEGFYMRTSPRVKLPEQSMGQRTMIESTATAAPSPAKWATSEFCDNPPEPLPISRVWLTPLATTLTRAPIAERLESVP